MASIGSLDGATGDSRAPRYLLVEVGGQSVAWELVQIREIVSARNVTRLPGAPVWVLGLLNLRGTVLTVVDLAQRLGLATKAEGGSVVVVEHEGRALGVRVDVVHAVVASADATVEPVEAARAADGLVIGMVRLADGPALLMDAGALCRSVLVTL
ncbi:MAG: chemotaxis protein CheW [Gemmatimonadaceae bacterium]